jgi:hypothetical protein
MLIKIEYSHGYGKDITTFFSELDAAFDFVFHLIQTNQLIALVNELHPRNSATLKRDGITSVQDIFVDPIEIKEPVDVAGCIDMTGVRWVAGFRNRGYFVEAFKAQREHIAKNPWLCNIQSPVTKKLTELEALLIHVALDSTKSEEYRTGAQAALDILQAHLTKLLDQDDFKTDTETPENDGDGIYVDVEFKQLPKPN